MLRLKTIMLFALFCPVLIMALVITLAVGFTQPTKLQAQTNSPQPNALLILDGSGSMWGKIKDGHKIMIARKAIANSLRPFEDKINLGLMAYGHRRRGSCLDIQLLSKPTNLNPLRFSRLLRQIKPLGKTPITNAIEKASKSFNDKGGSIILLADGPENCRKNPCTLVTPQFAKSKNITVHIIAFSMRPKDANSLRCLAANSGGKFLTPNNEAELESALTTAMNAALSGKDLLIGARTEKAKPLKKKRLKPELKLSAHLGPNSQTLTHNITWKIEKLNKDNAPEKDLPPWESQQPKPKFDLAQGKYRITTQYNDFQISKDLTLNKGDEIAQKMIFNLSKLVLPASWDKPNSRSGFGKLLLKSEDKSNLAHENIIIDLMETTQTQLIPAGAYKISAIENGNLQTWFIHAQAGKTVPLPIWKDTGRLSFTLKDLASGAPLTAPLLKLHILSNTQKLGKEIARSTARAPQFDLASGSYMATLQDGFAIKAFPLTIEPNTTTKLTIELDRATLRIKIPTKDTAQLNSLSIYKIEDNKRLIPLGTTSNLESPIHLSPGTYRFIKAKGSAGSTIIKTAQLRSGKTTVLSFNNQAAPITFKISDRTDPLSRHQIFWQLYEKSGALIWQSTKPEPNLKLARGNYRIMAEIGDQNYTKHFKLSGNRPQTIDLAKNRNN